jgi:long-chain fatty acid transport protein
VARGREGRMFKVVSRLGGWPQHSRETMNRMFRLTALIGCLSCLPGTAWAQGAMLHGIGPVNSSMGGAGAALLNESLGALTYNPALIAGAQGNQVSFTSEFFKDDIIIETTVDTLHGRAEPDSQLNAIPAFGWMLRDPKGKLALGFGLIGLAGFGADYAADSATLLFAPVPGGFGRIYTDFRETKIPVAFAYQVTPKLALGGSLNVYISEFAVAPLPYQFYDTDASGNRYYPEAGKMDRRWAVSGQFGFLYQATPLLGVGGSITLPHNYPAHEWNSTNPNPGSVDFGQPWTVSFDLDGPMIVTAGVGLKPGAKTQIAIDGMFTKYEGVHGFGGPGGFNNGVLDPFGWRDVWTFKTGIQQQVTDKLAVRAGYNFSQMPLRADVVLSATGAPATFQHHYCAGMGFKMFPFLEAEASFYYVTRDHVVGQFTDLTNEVVGTLDESNVLKAALIGLNFRF